eukprot:7041571-Pyramimonas_sp.AAC.1
MTLTSVGYGDIVASKDTQIEQTYMVAVMMVRAELSGPSPERDPLPLPCPNVTHLRDVSFEPPPNKTPLP